MNLFNSKPTIIYLEDRVGYIATKGNDKEQTAPISFDVPGNVIEDGRIRDNSQLHYLIKQNLEKAGASKSPCLFVVSTTDAVNRTMQVPTMSDKEIRSLIDNESDNLFVQNLEDYRMIYHDLESGEDIHHLLISICAEDLIQGYVDLAKGLGIKMTGLIPLSTYLMQYAHFLGGGRIGLMAATHDGFYYAHENRYYGRTESNDALSDLLDRHDIEFSDLLRVYEGQYDERIVDIDRDAFRRELESSFYDALSHIENIGNDFALEDHKLLTGSLAECGLYSDITTDSEYTLLPLDDIFSFATDHKDDLKFFSKKESGTTFDKKLILPIAVVVAAFAILVGSFMYGEKIKQENRELIVESTKQQEQEEAEASQSDHGGDQVDIADIITKVKNSAPDSITVTNLDYQSDTLAISGETTDSAAIESWKNELESVLGKSVNEEPTATIGDTIYFKFTVPLQGDASNSEEQSTDTGEDSSSDLHENSGTDSNQGQSL